MRRQTKHGRPSHGTVVAYLALFVAIGGSAYAAKQLPKNSVGSKQIRKGAVKTGDLARNAVKAGKLAKNAVPTNRLRDNAVTGAKVNEATLGTVPSANLANVANSANSLAPLEDWHLVGAPGEPGFLGSWENGPAPDGSPAAFFKDHEGIVHLRGMVTGAGLFVFQLPPGYRPASGKGHFTSIFCQGGGQCTESVGAAHIFGSGFGAAEDGGVHVAGALAVLDGVAFRAES